MPDSVVGVWKTETYASAAKLTAVNALQVLSCYGDLEIRNDGSFVGRFGHPDAASGQLVPTERQADTTRR
jgi:hypothetical protein